MTKIKVKIDLSTIYSMTKFERQDAKTLLTQTGKLTEGIKFSKNPVFNLLYFIKGFINNHKIIKTHLLEKASKRALNKLLSLSFISTFYLNDLFCTADCLSYGLF